MKTKLVLPLLLIYAVSAANSAENNFCTQNESFAKNLYSVETQQTKLTPEAERLFRGITSKLTISDKNKAAAAAKFVISKSENNLFTFAGEDDAPFEVQVTANDLNNDGTEEIILQWGNSFWSGHTGTSCTMLVKNVKTGDYDSNLGFPGIVEVLSTKTNGFRDLRIGGPGFEFPIYKWNGKSYEQKGIVRQ